jgi:hypothetical protein
MASEKWGNLRPGRREAADFDRLVSPLGQDVAETPAYSPSRPVNGAKQKNDPKGKAAPSGVKESMRGE